MLSAGSLIQSRFGNPGNFELLLWEPNRRRGEGPVAHHWGDNNPAGHPTHWHRATAVVEDATGPACLIQGTDGNLEALIPRGGWLAHFRMDAGDKHWRPVTTFAPGAVGPGALCEDRQTGETHAVARHGRRLVHYTRAVGRDHWEAGAAITEGATGPAAMAADAQGMVHVLVPEGVRLVHYVRSPRLGRWTSLGAVPAARVTAPAALALGGYGPAENPHLEAVVPEGDVLRHYRRPAAGRNARWEAVGVVTSRRGPIKAVSLAYTRVFGGSLEAMVVEANDSHYEYFTGPNEIAPPRWRRGTCFRVDEGPVVTRGTSEKVEQLTGMVDFPSRRPLKDADKHKIRGTDLGAAFRHGGRLYFLFGDTHWADNRCGPTRDVIAFTETRSAEKGLGLTFQRGCIDVRGGRVTMLEFDVPLDGFSHDGEMYVFLTSDHYRERWVMGRSVLTRCQSRDPGKDILDSYALPDRGPHAPIVFDYLGDLSTGGGAFINASVVLVGPREIARWGLPADGARSALLLWGSGTYRNDTIALACLPLPPGPPDLNRLRYFTGAPGGVARWSAPGRAHEQEAAPLFYPAAVGELSARWDPKLERWVLMYCTGPGDPAGLSVTLRVARNPWGPWSPRRVALDWQNEAMGKGPGKIIHLSGMDDGLNQDDTPFPRDITHGGAAYAPYHLPDFTTVRGGEFTLYYVLSTWNPYQSVLMRHRLTRADLARLEAPRR
jgi:hypothetical protein